MMNVAKKFRVIGMALTLLAWTAACSASDVQEGSAPLGSSDKNTVADPVTTSSMDTPETPSEEAPGTTQVQTLLADYPAYDSIGAAAHASDVVIEGLVVSSDEGKLLPDDLSGIDDPDLNPQYGLENPANPDESAIPIMISTIEVVRSLKGSIEPGTTIQVSQMGGDGVVEGGSTLLHDINSDGVILFLDVGDDGVYFAINPEIGVWSIKGQQVRPVNSGKSYSVHTLAEMESAVSER